MAGPIKSINLIASDVIPGGTLDTGRWRRLQDLVNELTDTVNTLTAGRSAWHGLGLILTALGDYTLATDESYVFLNFASNAVAANLTITLPTIATASGPVTVLSGSDTYYTVKAAYGNHLLRPTTSGGSPVSSDSITEGVHLDGLMLILVPLKDPADSWSVIECELSRIN